ncbi:MAG: rhamnose ABC transporter substrate-binding protein [Lachnospiraceae bacterium]
MKKKVLSVILCAAMASALLAGCGSSGTDTTTETSSTTSEAASTEAASTEEASTEAASTEAASTETGDADLTTDGTYAIIVKNAGNPYNEKESSGFVEVIEAMGGTAIVKEPASATAEDQIAMINELVSQGVDAIAIAANDTDALQPALQAAMDAGIHVSGLDSATNAASREVFVNQAGVDIIGQTLMDAVLDISGGEGQWAILSATSQATNQNAWIESMKSVMTGADYAGLELVDVVYGDDEYQKSVDQTTALLQNYPDLKVICAPTTVGIMAAAKVLQDTGSACKLTGLGLPSEMADYIGTDASKSCPYMFLWNPIDIGRLSAYTSIALVKGVITGAEGDVFTAGELGTYTVTLAADGGTEIILGPPFEFNGDNIEEWKTVY